MTDNKEIWFIGIGLAAGGFITVFSNFFEFILTPFFPDPKSIVLLKTISGVLAIVCGLGVLKWYSKHPPKKISDDENKSEDSTKNKNEKLLDSKLNPEQKMGSSVNNDLHGNKKLVILDVGIFVIVGFGLFYAGYLYFHDDFLLYNFSETTFNDTEGKIPNFDISYNFTTTVLAAQNDIKVSIVAKLNDHFIQDRPVEANKVNKIFVYFPTSNPNNPQYEEGHILSYPIVLHRSALNGNFFIGNDTIKYQSEGDKCTFVTDTELKQSSDCPNKIHPLYHISSSDSYFQYRNNKITLALTWVLIAFTVVSLRDFFKNMFQNISLFNHKTRDNTEQKKKDRPKR